MKFGTLAEAAIATLTKPPNTDIGAMMRERFNTAPAYVAKLRRLIQSAPRYVLADDFTAAFARLSTKPAEVLLRAARFARMPYPMLWVEWNEHVRTSTVSAGLLDGDEGIAERVGFLLEQSFDDENGAMVEVLPMFVIEQSVYVCMSCYTLLLGDWPPQELARLSAPHDLMVQTLAERGIPDSKRYETNLYTPMGRSYAASSAAVDPATTDALRQRMLGAFNGLYPKNEDKTVLEIAAQELNQTNGDARAALAILSLLTDAPETTLRIKREQGKKHFVGGKFLPAYEYKVVSITRPVEERVIDLVERLPRNTWTGKRHHSVEGHWCYSHKKGSLHCDHTDHWQPHLKDGRPVGSQQFICAKCGKLRWWQPAHTRGNPALGTVEKGYEVKASTAAETRAR